MSIHISNISNKVWLHFFFKFRENLFILEYFSHPISYKFRNPRTTSEKNLLSAKKSHSAERREGPQFFNSSTLNGCKHSHTLSKTRSTQLNTETNRQSHRHNNNNTHSQTQNHTHAQKHTLTQLHI
jgi:hypothetical protein